MNAKAFIIPLVLLAAIPAYHYLQERPRASDGQALPPASFQVRNKIRLNDATRDDLVTVRGIGDSLAGKIMEARPSGGFRSWDEVDAVPGVGPAKLNSLREHFEVP